MSFDEYKVDVPKGKSGEWSVEHRVITDDDEAFQRLQATANPHRRPRIVPAGNYTYLFRGGAVVMSDTPGEIRDFLPFIRRASGRLLIAGLGLGVVLRALLQKPEVTTITVVEKSRDVVNLVWPFVWPTVEPRVTLIVDDIFTWEPPKGARYDYAWFDIWTEVSADDWPAMMKLHRRYARYADHLESWMQEECRDAARRERGR